MELYEPKVDFGSLSFQSKQTGLLFQIKLEKRLFKFFHILELFKFARVNYIYMRTQHYFNKNRNR